MLYLMSPGAIVKDLEQVIIMRVELCSRILTLITKVKSECPVSRRPIPGWLHWPEAIHGEA